MVQTKRERSGRGTERKRLVPWKRGPSILLVEDDLAMRQLLAAVLRRDGYYVIEAADGDGALDFLGPGVLEGYPDRLPALVLSDIRLPYFSGLDILEGLQMARRRPPVVLITGFGDEETHARARELGAARVLDKPFTMDELRSAVRDALRPPEPSPPRPPDGHVL